MAVPLWWAATLASKMHYLWRWEVNLEGGRLRDFLDGEVPQTPLHEALLAAGVIERRE